MPIRHAPTDVETPRATTTPDLSIARTQHELAESPDLEVRIRASGKRNLIVGLHGELDEHTAPLLDIVLNAVAHHGSHDRKPGNVTFDLAGVRFIYLRGLEILQTLCARLTNAGWQISLVNESNDVADLLAIARHHHSLMLTDPAIFPADAP